MKLDQCFQRSLLAPNCSGEHTSKHVPTVQEKGGVSGCALLHLMFNLTSCHFLSSLKPWELSALNQSINCLKDTKKQEAESPHFSPLGHHLMGSSSHVDSHNIITGLGRPWAWREGSLRVPDCPRTCAASLLTQCYDLGAACCVLQAGPLSLSQFSSTQVHSLLLSVYCCSDPPDQSRGPSNLCV